MISMTQLHLALPKGFEKREINGSRLRGSVDTKKVPASNSCFNPEL